MSLPLHPAIVHLPLAGALLAVPLAAAIAFLVRRGWPRRTWGLAAGLQLVSFLGAVAALNTGEDMEERVEDSVPEAQIHAHEAHAQRFTVALGVSAAALVGAALLPVSAAALVDGLALVAAAAALGLALPTGHSGGSMVYGEAAQVAEAPRVERRELHETEEDEAAEREGR